MLRTTHVGELRTMHVSQYDGYPTYNIQRLNTLVEDWVLAPQRASTTFCVVGQIPLESTTWFCR